MRKLYGSVEKGINSPILQKKMKLQALMEDRESKCSLGEVYSTDIRMYKVPLNFKKKITAD